MIKVDENLTRENVEEFAAREFDRQFSHMEDFGLSSVQMAAFKQFYTHGMRDGILHGVIGLAEFSCLAMAEAAHDVRGGV